MSDVTSSDWVDIIINFGLLITVVVTTFVTGIRLKRSTPDDEKPYRLCSDDEKKERRNREFDIFERKLWRKIFIVSALTIFIALFIWEGWWSTSITHTFTADGIREISGIAVASVIIAGIVRIVCEISVKSILVDYFIEHEGYLFDEREKNNTDHTINANTTADTR